MKLRLRYMRVSRKSARSSVLGFASSLLIVWMVMVVGIFMAMPKDVTAASSPDKFCFTAANCHIEMAGKSICSSKGCCIEDRCFLPGGGCKSLSSGKSDGKGGSVQGKCYAKSPPISLSVSFGSTTRVVDLGQYLEAAYDYGLGIAAFLAAIMMVVGGFMYLTAGANPTRVSRGKQFITDAMLGLAVLLGAYLMLQTINPALLSMQLPKVPIIKRTDFIGCEMTKFCKGCGVKYGVTEEFVKAIKDGTATKGGVSGTGSAAESCSPKFIVAEGASDSITTCVGGSCSCVSDGKCPSTTYKCDKVNETSKRPECASMTGASPENTGYTCYSCKASGESCNVAGKNKDCCSGFCNGYWCSGGQAGDSCGKDFITSSAEANATCATGICATKGLNTCSTGLEGSICWDDSECKGSLKCQTDDRNFCASGNNMTWCEDSSECEKGWTCMELSSNTPGAWDKDAKLCVPTRLANSSISEAVIYTVSEVSIWPWKDNEDKEKVFSVGFGESGQGLPCMWDSDCKGKVQTAMRRYLNVSNLTLLHCIKPEARGVGFCSTGVVGAFCYSKFDCNTQFCVDHVCTTGDPGAWCQKNSQCKSNLCNTRPIGNSHAKVCVSGGPGSRCASSPNSQGLRCLPGLTCTPGKRQGMDLCLPGKQCPTK